MRSTSLSSTKYAALFSAAILSATCNESRKPIGAVAAPGSMVAERTPEHANSHEFDASADPCDVPGGVLFHGKRRYVHGVNYAWRSFGADFGGLAKWHQPSVSQDPASVDRDFAAMAATGASVVRMWIFPDLRGDGVTFDRASGALQLSALVLQDIESVLALAQKHDLYLLLVLTSFDAFKQPMNRSGVPVPSLAPLVRDATLRTQFIQTVVRPIIAKAQTSRYRHRVFGWDLINEPEWAMRGAEIPGMCGTKDEQVDCLEPEQMHALVGALSAEVHMQLEKVPAAETPLVTIGSVRPAAVRGWTYIPQDFYQFHFYQHDYARGGYTPPKLDKPVVIGELPSWGMDAEAGKPSMSAREILKELRNEGYAGALPWGYTKLNSRFDWARLGADLKHVSVAEGCRARY